MQIPWKNGRWFSGPWDHEDQVASGHQFPDEIQVHDVTLREGDQQPGAVFTIDPGIIATRFCNAGDADGTAAVPFLPALAGRDGPAIVYGKGSGIDPAGQTVHGAGPA